MKVTRPADFDAARCRRRARLAAVRDGVDASPLAFLDYGLTDEDESIRLINRSLSAQGNVRLNLDDVYIHHVEAASSRFIGDRFMFLDRSTLKNIASAGSSGIAFMNSHRTGGLSAPSELPFGRTFSGRFEEFTDPQTGESLGRTTLGIYMLRDSRPNGAAGPSTDDLHKSIEAGTLSDVSMGLSGGTRVCDVCGEDLSAKHPETGKFLCGHAPGTHRGMELEHREAQTARGVKGGKASYTLVDAMPQEVSAVFKGAVPGAGFRKALALSRAGQLGRVELSEARESYAGLLESNDRTFGPSRRAFSMRGVDVDILKAFRFWQAAAEPEELDIEAFAEKPPQTKEFKVMTTLPPAEDPEKVALRAKVEELEAKDQKARVDGYYREAERFATEEIEARRLKPAQKDDLVRVYTALAAFDHDSPVPSGPSRVDTYRAAQSRVRPHDLTKEEIGTEPVLPRGSRVLSDDPEPEDKAAKRAERLLTMLTSTPDGRAAHAARMKS